MRLLSFLRRAWDVSSGTLFQQTQEGTLLPLPADIARSLELMQYLDVLGLLERAFKESGEVLLTEVKLFGHLGEQLLSHQIVSLGNSYANVGFAIQRVPSSEVLPGGSEYHVKLPLARPQHVMCLVAAKPHCDVSPSTH